MKGSIKYAMLAGIALLSLSACTTMDSLKTKIANAQLQKKQLADGSAVYIDFNLTPTSAWNCQQVGTPQSYNWAMLKTQGQFQFSGPHGLLMDKALAYANQQNLKTNYINLQIPTEQTFSVGSGRVTNGFNLSPNDQAIAVYYQCEKINPEHNLGVERKREIGVKVD